MTALAQNGRDSGSENIELITSRACGLLNTVRARAIPKKMFKGIPTLNIVYKDSAALSIGFPLTRPEASVKKYKREKYINKGALSRSKSKKNVQIIVASIALEFWKMNRHGYKLS